MSAIDFDNSEEFAATVTDEEMRHAVVDATYSYLRADGNDVLYAIHGSRLMGEVFDHWPDKRDTEIFGEGYDTGYGEGHYQGYAEGEGVA